MANPADLLSVSDVARLAGVRPSAVANWRDRHDDFPAPAARSGAGPVFQREDVLSWLEANRPDHARRVQPLGIEAQLWRAADALRNNMDAAEYKHVVLGLIFLKYISDAFEAKHAELEAEKKKGADPEDPDEYRAVSIFWVPKEARWAHLKAS